MSRCETAATVRKDDDDERWEDERCCSTAHAERAHAERAHAEIMLRDGNNGRTVTRKDGEYE